ncbi:DUF6194 family protein [Pseudonocardia endophytica]|uniref:DUF6194 domain-containing protein n=1 Tax=Pseudonocardia endophytica TaxID=401976 RepID=A0A4R1HDP5_PSEEN|nr:DUF6194 family protein [Pseudonocardia endophytica]TCK20164.1 hypothetical protein EV378_4114 [Pseudonocardia endophytica]
MRDDEIREYLTAHFPGTRLLEANGDAFAVHDPGGDLPPERRLPWATVVTADMYTPDGDPWDVGSQLDRPGIFRLNIGLPRAAYRELDPPEGDLTAVDVLLPHPTYASIGWVCVLNPDRTWPDVVGLLDEAYGFAARKYENARDRR